MSTGRPRVTQKVEMALDGRTGYAYVLRSRPDGPQVKAIPDLHKIGYTTSPVAQRTNGAARHETFLGADVEETAVYEMPAAMGEWSASFIGSS